MAHDRLSSPPRRVQGFSLIEVLVAFTILGLAFGALLQVFGDGIAAVDRSASVTRAALLAESQLARLGADERLQVGESEERTDDDMRVRTVVREWQGTSAVRPSERLVGAYEVDVTVTWSDGDVDRSVSVQTLKLQARER